MIDAVKNVMLTVAPAARRRFQMRLDLEADAFDLAKISVPELAAAILKREPIAELAAFTASNPHAMRAFQAVYIIGPDDAPYNKIGIANDPFRRLDTFRVGYWGNMSIKGLLWTSGQAGFIEARALWAARNIDKLVRGEWTSMGDEKAAEVLAAAAKHIDHPCCDTETFLGEWVPIYDRWSLSHPLGALKEPRSDRLRRMNGREHYL